MKKKQTKEVKKAARKAKLNPNNHKTAKDVADERDKKRRLEDEEAERAAAGLDGPIERPGEGIKAHKAKVPKTTKSQDVHSKSKKDESSQPEVNGQPDTAASKEEKKQAKEAKRKEKRAAKVAKEASKKLAKKAKKEAANGTAPNADADDDEEEADEEEDDDEDEVDTTAIHPDTDMDRIDMSGLVDESSQKDRASSSRSASPALEFSPYHNERSSSTSSIAPEVEDLRQAAAAAAAKQTATAPATKTPAANEKHETVAEAQARREAQRARLQELIDRKRTERNADGLNGKPARSRTELIEARRQKEQQRKDKKKEIRAQEKEAVKKAEMEAHLASLRGSPALGSELFAPRSRSASVSSPGVNNNSFSFGRVAFTDGARINSSLSGLAENTKKAKGPLDTKTALLVAEKHQARLNGLDATKRADLEEKDVWLNARKRINGEKILDDVNLLRKSLKRKEKAKKASEKAWGERTEGVKKSQEARQKKREENLAKRRDEKGGGGKKKGGTGAGVKKKKKGGKPGFR
jgi:hypothetical protein